MLCLFSSKRKQNEKCENVVANRLYTKRRNEWFKIKERKKASKTALNGKNKKNHWFQVSGRLSLWEINQVTSKCQQIFRIKLAKRCKT